MFSLSFISSVVLICPSAGATVVEDITTISGTAVTSVMYVLYLFLLEGRPLNFLQRQTLSTTSSTVTPITLPTEPYQGPVGQPGPAPSGAPIVYQYTTTDSNGQTTVIIDTFTPSFAPTGSAPLPSDSGTILNYSSWLSIIGTNTVPPSNSAVARWKIPIQASLGIATSILGVFTGALIIFTAWHDVSLCIFFCIFSSLIGRRTLYFKHICIDVVAV